MSLSLSPIDSFRVARFSRLPIEFDIVIFVTFVAQLFLHKTPTGNKELGETMTCLLPNFH